MNTPDIETTLRAAYIDAGGTEDGYRLARPELLEAHRRQVALDAARQSPDGLATLNADIRTLAFRGRRTTLYAIQEQWGGAA